MNKAFKHFFCLFSYTDNDAISDFTGSMVLVYCRTMMAFDYYSYYLMSEDTQQKVTT